MKRRLKIERKHTILRLDTSEHVCETVENVLLNGSSFNHSFHIALIAVIHHVKHLRLAAILLSETHDGF